MDARDFEALGLWERTADHADQRLELLEFLVGLGASAEDLIAYRDGLPGLASVLALRGGAGLTLPEVVARSGLEESRILAFTRAAGFPTPGPEDRVFTEALAGLGAGLAGAEAVFGREVVLQLVRVMGTGMARLADAIVSAFLVNVEPAAARDPVGLGVARANAEAAALIPVVAPALDLILRQHLLLSRRSSLADDPDAGYETQTLAVGFVDLVGSTALAQQVSTRELGSLLGAFEDLVSETVIEGGGRVVKLIGDEVLYTVPDARQACEIALRLTRALRDHERLPPVRAGLAAGLVMLRDGDVFGPVVNLAARIVAVAAPSEVVVPLALSRQVDLPAHPVGSRLFKGFAEPIELACMEG